MDEDQAFSFLALWESGHKRSWSENKLLKAARKKDGRRDRPSEATSRKSRGAAIADFVVIGGKRASGLIDPRLSGKRARASPTKVVLPREL